jgi:uncharacterized iron-regulated membrane protein
MDRRSFLAWASTLAGALVARRAAAQGSHSDHSATRATRGHQAAPPAPPSAAAPSSSSARPPPSTAPARPAPAAELAGNLPVVMPDGHTLPWRTVGGVKVGVLVAEELDHEVAPGLRARACTATTGRPLAP